MNVHEVDIIHVKLLRFFKNAEVALAPDEKLSVVRILDQGCREASRDHLQDLDVTDCVDSHRDREVLLRVPVMAAHSQLMLPVSAGSEDPA